MTTSVQRHPKLVPVRRIVGWFVCLGYIGIVCVGLEYMAMDKQLMKLQVNGHIDTISIYERVFLRYVTPIVGWITVLLALLTILSAIGWVVCVNLTDPVDTKGECCAST